MPFESEAQRRFMHAQHPEIANRWEHEYPHGKLPHHKKRKRARLKAVKRRAHR
jgi:hypothetical protein